MRQECSCCVNGSLPFSVALPLSLLWGSCSTTEREWSCKVNNEPTNGMFNISGLTRRAPTSKMLQRFYSGVKGTQVCHLEPLLLIQLTSLALQKIDAQAIEEFYGLTSDISKNSESGYILFYQSRDWWRHIESILFVCNKGIKVVPRQDILTVVNRVPCPCHRTTGDKLGHFLKEDACRSQGGVSLWFSFWAILYVLSSKIYVTSTWNLAASSVQESRVRFQSSIVGWSPPSRGLSLCFGFCYFSVF